MRVDDIEYCGKIDDVILRMVDVARFVVADLALQRGGVYFEAGYALGRRIPVVWTCRKDDMSNRHFDVGQYNCIDWVGEVDLRIRLTRRLKEAREIRGT